MKIALDAMGGDKAPKETVAGAILALKEFPNISIVLVGREKRIQRELRNYQYDSSRLEIVNAEEIITMDDDPVVAVRAKKDSSMNVALDLVKDGRADACVSAGNTGALISASQLKLKRIKGVLRPAIATIFPAKHGHVVVLDVGANADCKPEFLAQFAILGSKYAKVALKNKDPKVALLNIGSEEGKGNEITRASYDLLKSQTHINFVGNIEPHTMLQGKVDVVVTDGYTGNILLKATEGTAKFLTNFLKSEIKKSYLSMMGAYLMKNVFSALKKKMDSSEYGGAIFLGLNYISVKAHGGSDAVAIKNAIKVAGQFVEQNFVEEVKKEMANLTAGQGEEESSN